MFTTSPINISMESRARILKGEPMLDNTQELVVISKRDYLEMEKAKRNAEYLKMLDESYAQLERGETISFTMEELDAMASDGWVPTQKVKDFIEKRQTKLIPF